MEAKVPKCHAVCLQGSTGRSAGTSGWDGLVWRLKYLNAISPGVTSRSVDHK